MNYEYLHLKWHLCFVQAKCYLMMKDLKVRWILFGSILWRILPQTPFSAVDQRELESVGETPSYRCYRSLAARRVQALVTDGANPALECYGKLL